MCRGHFSTTTTLLLWLLPPRTTTTTRTTTPPRPLLLYLLLMLNLPLHFLLQRQPRPSPPLLLHRRRTSPPSMPSINMRHRPAPRPTHPAACRAQVGVTCRWMHHPSIARIRLSPTRTTRSTGGRIRRATTATTTAIPVANRPVVNTCNRPWARTDSAGAVIPPRLPSLRIHPTSRRVRRLLLRRRREVRIRLLQPRPRGIPDRRRPRGHNPACAIARIMLWRQRLLLLLPLACRPRARFAVTRVPGWRGLRRDRTAAAGEVRGEVSCWVGGQARGGLRGEGAV